MNYIIMVVWLWQSHSSRIYCNTHVQLKFCGGLVVSSDHDHLDMSRFLWFWIWFNTTPHWLERQLFELHIFLQLGKVSPSKWRWCQPHGSPWWLPNLSDPWRWNDGRWWMRGRQDAFGSWWINDSNQSYEGQIGLYLRQCQIEEVKQYAMMTRSR